jgi:hypothetical protein
MGRAEEVTNSIREVSREEVRSPRAAIEAKARGAIDVALHANEVDYHLGAGAKRLASQVTAEYHDRFLIELIQNAHDAHPREGHAGVVKILFDPDEEPFGVLYVGNGGHPFSHSNFRTICELGLSDKAPGEGIGNKGIGFKSVLQVCQRPEIYSAGPRRGASFFDGYCFSFATDRELLQLLEGDESRLEIVRKETGRFQIPVALGTEVPEQVSRFAAEGLATVVRLPLDRAGATDEVEQQLELLMNQSAPILLFLDRLASLTIKRGSKDGAEEWALERRNIPSELEFPHGNFELVDLGAQGLYLRSSVRVPRSRVREAVEDSVERRQIDETWLEWNEEAWVSAAVRLDEEGKEGRLYTYLPMEVDSPFNGHLNAPFYAKLDRRNVDPDVTLNALLLDAGAEACALGALAISTGDSDLRDADVDLIAWNADESDRLRRAFHRLESDVVEAKMIPVSSGRGETWGSLSTAYRPVEETTKVLTASAFVEASDVEFISGSIGESRGKKIEVLHKALMGRGMEPTADEMAEWVQNVAESARKKRRISWWNQFYEDLALLFEHSSAALAGRRILLDEEKVLQATAMKAAEGTRGPTVFFQPVRERAEGLIDIEASDDVSIPASLRREIVFLHPELEWLERDGSTRRKRQSRRFLEDEGLVRPYLARDLLEHIRELLSKSKSKTVSSDALRLAFRLQRTRGYDHRPSLGDLGLRVPTRGGWSPAQQALFSGKWPSTLGESVESLIKLAGPTSSEFQSLADSLLLAPEEWPFRIDVDAWREFLRKVGVQDGLVPQPIQQGVHEYGWSLSADTISKPLGLEEPLTSYWTSAVVEEGDLPTYETSPYVNKSPVYVLPGQREWSSLLPRALEEFAYLLVASCGEWHDEYLTLQFQRSNVVHRNFDLLSWPSPVSAFLKKADWLPIERQIRDELSFVKPSGAWHFSESLRDESDYSRPECANLLPIRFRRALDARAGALERLRAAGLNVWNDPKEAPRLLEHLGRLVEEGFTAEMHWPSLSKACQQAWEYLLDLDEVELDLSRFVGRRGNRISCLNLDDPNSGVLCVPDGGSGMVDSVLHLSTLPVLEVDAHIGGRVCDLLQERFGVACHQLGTTSARSCH